MDAPYAILEPLEPGIGRLLARNPSPYTYTGTQTYFAGAGDDLVVVDGAGFLNDGDLVRNVATVAVAGKK